MYAAYDENEIGALDCDEIEGYVAHDSDLILQYAVEFEKKQKEDVSIVGKYNEKYTSFLCTYRQRILRSL